jgi:hypothetical protein
MAKRQCAVCGVGLPPKSRIDAIYCSNKCTVRAFRIRREIASKIAAKDAIYGIIFGGFALTLDDGRKILDALAWIAPQRLVTLHKYAELLIADAIAADDRAKWRGDKMTSHYEIGAHNEAMELSIRVEVALARMVYAQEEVAN